ncbi:MAG: hypothetical protein R2875_01335 [Desulfobacterales bacterium]
MIGKFFGRPGKRWIPWSVIGQSGQDTPAAGCANFWDPFISSFEYHKKHWSRAFNQREAKGEVIPVPDGSAEIGLLAGNSVFERISCVNKEGIFK